VKLKLVIIVNYDVIYCDLPLEWNKQTKKKVTMPFLVRSTRDCITILKPKFITDFLGHDHERHYIDFALLEGRVGQANFGD
jgi:hypothetical protein